MPPKFICNVWDQTKHRMKLWTFKGKLPLCFAHIHQAAILLKAWQNFWRKTYPLTMLPTVKVSVRNWCIKSSPRSALRPTLGTNLACYLSLCTSWVTGACPTQRSLTPTMEKISTFNSWRWSWLPTLRYMLYNGLKLRLVCLNKHSHLITTFVILSSTSKVVKDGHHYIAMLTLSVLLIITASVFPIWNS